MVCVVQMKYKHYYKQTHFFLISFLKNYLGSLPNKFMSVHPNNPWAFVKSSALNRELSAIWDETHEWLSEDNTANR